MTNRFKNKVIIYFDKEHTQSLRVFLHTLEQSNVFAMFMKRCTTIPYISYEQFSYKNGNWKLQASQEFEPAEEFTKTRANAAPYYLSVEICGTHKREAFSFDIYFFSSLDIDYYIHLLQDGTKSGDIEFKAYIRDRETHDWNQYTWGESIPHDVASNYLSLSSQNKAKANDVISKLTRV